MDYYKNNLYIRVLKFPVTITRPGFKMNNKSTKKIDFNI